MTFYTTTAETDGTAISLTLTIPPGAAAGNYATIIMVSSTSFNFSVTPAGWTKIVDTFNGTNLPVRILTQQLSSGSGTVTFTPAPAPGAGSPWMLAMVVAADAGAVSLRAAGGAATANFIFSVVGTTNSGELIPPGPYPAPQAGDTIIYVGAGYAVPPPTPPVAMNVALSAGSPLLAFPGTHATGFGSYLQILVKTGAAAVNGNVSVTATVTTNNGVGAIVIALHAPPPVGAGGRIWGTFVGFTPAGQFSGGTQ